MYTNINEILHNIKVDLTIFIEGRKQHEKIMGRKNVIDNGRHFMIVCQYI